MSKKKSTLSLWPTYLVFAVIVIFFSGLSGYIYLQTQKVPVKVAAQNIATTTKAIEEESTTEEEAWKLIYPEVKPMTIAEVEVQASVAKNWPDRIKGLSGTPYLPEHVVKLFIFDSAAFHSIWMKDMKYSIDIIWVDEESKIVHIEEGASPESFPASFVTEVPAKYVIETVENFVSKNKIEVGNVVVLPSL
jgi:uncharacterized membrane protein (UPF0127 family)